MAKETKVRRVKAKDDAAKTSSSAPQKTETSKPKISKYRAKVEGVELSKKKKSGKKLPKWLAVILAPFIFVLRIVGKVLGFILRPLAPLGRYFRDSWRELKLVRWPTRRETWKMTGSVIAFSVIFAGVILALDGIFSWIFKTILGN
ncbi:MAG: preprotein translocase subunit SecE [bacterium]|nr:preprotein translocase subunit SecE [bacterium]